jgi:hypothetical protein
VAKIVPVVGNQSGRRARGSNWERKEGRKEEKEKREKKERRKDGAESAVSYPGCPKRGEAAQPA